MRAHGRAHINARAPSALGVCDRCGFLYNLIDLQNQVQWQGPRLQSIHAKVCDSCLDVPQEQLRTITIPADPMPVSDPRIESYNAETGPFQGLGTPIGTLVDWGGLAAAFDWGGINFDSSGADPFPPSKPANFCAALQTATSSFTNTIGLQWNVGAQPVDSVAETQTVNVTRFQLYAPNDMGFCSAGAVSYVFQGSSDGATWTTLYSSTTSDAVGQTIDVESGLTSGSYSYHQVAFDGTSGGTIAVAQLVIFGTGLN